MKKQPIDRARILTDQKYKDYLRWRVATDLLWLAKDLLGYNKIDEHDHRELADLFVKKDPDKPLELQDPVFKVRLALMPRLTFKTTFNIADCVQWICPFPDIAIMVMVASNSDDTPLGDTFVEEVASHFYNPPDTPDEQKKLLTLIYPEHELTQLPTKGRFTTPARTKYRRDFTLRAVSIEQSLSGWHPDVIKSEDVQDNRNSQTPNMLKKVRKNFYINIKMLPEWGYLDLTATRYGPADLYGHMMQKTNQKRMKVLWKSAYIRKPHALKKEEWELTRDDVILQFPKLLPWDFLVDTRVSDENSFWTQYMNVAEGNFKPTFPMEKLLAAKVPADDTPWHGTPHVAWRFETADSKNDAAAVGMQDAGRMYIVEMFAGPMGPTSRAEKLVQLCKKWETHEISIEDTPGAQSHAQHIMNAALENEWRVTIRWTDFLQDAGTQSLFIKGAEPHLLAGRLLFSDEIPDISAKFQLLYQYGMSDELELPCVVAQVAHCLPHTIAAQDFNASDDDEWEGLMHQDAMDRVYGRGRYKNEQAPLSSAELEAIANEAWEPQTDHMGLDNMMPGLNG